MRRLTPFFGAALLLATMMLAGCGRQAEVPKDAPQAQIDKKPGAGNPIAINKKDDKQAPKQVDAVLDASKLPITPAFAVDANQEKYEAALTDGLTFVAQKKYPEALAALESARSLQDSDFIKGEIAKVQARMEQDGSAKKTVDDIESVLEQGNATEAAKLATAGLAEFGDGDAGKELVKLKLQADALISVQQKETDPVRFERLVAAGDAAVKEKNLRAAGIAFEQALLTQENAAVKQKLDGVRANLDKYDALRKRAADLRPDPTQLEDAVAALQDAQKVWDTLQIRADIDEYTLALQKRRDAVSIADFDIRTNLGLPGAGKSIAEELLPNLKPRFELVERGQLQKVIDELKLEQGGLDDPAQQREIGRLANVRYMVLGSVYQLGKVTAQARLVDVRTGLVVQTAKVSAPTAQDLFPLLPELAKQLLMNDAEKLAYDTAQVEKLAQKPAVIDDEAPLPAPPEAPQQGAAPALADPVGVVAAPALGGLKIDAFKNLPPAPLPQAGVLPPAPPPNIDAGFEVRLKRRLLGAAIERGDFFVRIGRFNDAQRQFQLALQLAPGNADVALRLNQVQPLLLPPQQPFLAVNQPGFYMPRPRVAIMNFLTAGNPVIVPPYLAWWTPQNLAPYFTQQLDVVDNNEVYWYMARTGVTMNDLMYNPYARQWIGRALGIRYFVLGTIQQTASFDVNTYLLDAEAGYLQGNGYLHVANQFELRLRLDELAMVTMMTPDQRALYLNQQQAAQFDVLMAQGRQALFLRDYPTAINAFQNAQAMRPRSIDVMFYLAQAQQGQRTAVWQAGIARNLAQQQADIAAAQQRNFQLLLSVNHARHHSPAVPAQVLIDQRTQAQKRLVVQASAAVRMQEWNCAAGLYDGALAIAPAPAGTVVVLPAPAPGIDPYRELALARAKAAQVQQTRIVELTAHRETMLRKEREDQLAAAQKALAIERKRLDAERAAHRERDEAAYKRSMTEGQRLLTANNYDGAIAAFHAAQRLKKTPAVDLLLEQALDQRAVAQVKDAQAKKTLEARLEAERARRINAENEAKVNQKRYESALALAHDALKARDYDIAQAKYKEAGNLYKTDAVLTGLRNIDAARAQQQAAIKHKQEQAEQPARVQQFVAQGNAALEAKKFDEAHAAFQQAKKLDPAHVDALAGLAKAEQAQGRLDADARRKGEEAQRQADFQKLLTSGQASLAGKQYAAAVASLGAALKLNPADKTAQSALAEAEKSAGADAKGKAADYQKRVAEGRIALGSKRYDDAIKAFADAQKVLPGDTAAKDFEAQAIKAKKDAADLVTAAAKKQADELKKADDTKKALADVRTALAGRNVKQAEAAFALAQKLAPDHPDLKKAAAELEQLRGDTSAAALAQKKRQEDYQALIDQGNKALKLKDYAAAVKAFTGATTLMPDDKAGRSLLQQAQALAKEAGTDNAAAQVQDLLKKGQAALDAKKYKDAAAAFTSAAKLAPTDTKIAQLLRQAQTALDAELANEAALTKTQAAYGTAMKTGQAALTAKKYDDAVKSFTAALKLVPKDARAEQLLIQAKAGQEAEIERRTQYVAEMKQGNAALVGKRFGDAKKHFQEALKVMPNDMTALRGLALANQGTDVNPKTPVKDKRTLYLEEMKAGVGLEARQKFQDAVEKYDEALKLMPNDPQALQARRRAEFNWHFTDGQKHLQAGRGPDAVRALELALKLSPGNPNVQQLLTKAKALK